ncbi:hypothetical protein [Haloferula sargassicola]|uniref:Uncharacterized protein n=1 Tax=Haloferula sargassicola TaxID=490096 RepID=A0ABP9UYJ5_9BACT
MKAFLPLLLLLPASAQDFAPKDSERDPILSNLLLKEAEEAAATPIHPETDALLVTGNPPPEADLVKSTDKPAEEAEPADHDFPEATAGTPEPTPKGARITVQEGSSNAAISSDRIDLKAPFQPKLLGTPPAGWRLSEVDTVPPVEETVTLANGAKVPLSIRPYLLVPDANGDTSFALTEPGFQASKGYAQTDTVGSILADSIHHLDDDSDRLAATARKLGELLDSLPSAPTTSPTEEP